ncbi:MAG: hypothetical protein Kow0031_05610 [Anaerolineae bacterium]
MKNLQNAPNPQLPLPTAPQFLLFFLLLGWLAIAPVLVGGFAFFLPDALPPALATLLQVAALGLLLLLPAAAFAALARWQQWVGAMPLAIALLAASLFVPLAAALRALAQPGSSTETLLYLLVLTPATLLIGGVGLLWAGVPRWMLPHAFGLDAPPLAGLLTAAGLVALLTLGWPLTGALGDSWTSQLLLLQSLALTLPPLLFFFGGVLGIITFNFQHRKVMAALLALALYLAAAIGDIVPRGDWIHILSPLLLAPVALLVVELRALTGSIWAGLLLGWLAHAAPPLFTDPRDELPFITQPWQMLARLWMWLAAIGLVLLLWAGRQFLAPRWTLGRWPTLGLAAAAALLLGGLWGGLWLAVGRPGFHNDGFLIIMAEQADLSAAAAIADPLARRAAVRDQLLATAEASQPPVRQTLEAAGLDYRPYYIINMIEVRGSHRRMDDFAALPGVARVLLNPNVRPYPLAYDMPYGSAPQEGQGVGWNIDQANADDAWAQGITGQGVVVAGQDTGYDWEHPALRRAYRGSDGDHNYDWHDAWGDAVAPFDDGQHGTHTMGTILGDDGSGNQVGMAPGAQWIGCRNMRRGLGNPASYTGCMEFFLAPYPLGGNPFTDGDVTLAPHVINNSWGCPDIEGCDDTVLEPATAALRAAGIMMVVSAGNDGPGCQTVMEPPARYDNVFSVGATDSLGQITGFSSRGPVPDSDPLLKPDIAAPGANIRSSIPGGGYGLADGTSMAGPHVAGLVALLWSANPALIGNIDATEQIIRQSARPVEVSGACPVDLAEPGEPSLLDEFAAIASASACACGEVSGTPNNVYGWGEIDALRAVELARRFQE